MQVRSDTDTIQVPRLRTVTGLTLRKRLRYNRHYNDLMKIVIMSKFAGEELQL